MTETKLWTKAEHAAFRAHMEESGKRLRKSAETLHVACLRFRLAYERIVRS